jgi:TolB-like protein/Tfp pilus assembly protein PilF
VDSLLLAELKRRRVFRALVGYGVVAFAVLQIVEPVMHGLHWPDEVLTYVVVALSAGFPVVAALAWIFDVREGRIERTAPAAGRAPSLVVPVLAALSVAAAAPGALYLLLLRPRAQPAAAAPSVAVMPLANLSSDKEQGYFADGLAEELLNLLAKVPGLRVVGRSSSFSFKGKNEDLRTIGQKLNVSAVLEGSVRRSGDQMRITTQLVSTADGYHLWSETFDRKVTDVFAVQDEIARAVVTALRVKLLPAQAPTTQGRRTPSADAYAQYLLGVQLYNLTTQEGVRQAAQAFEKAVALDSSYAPAWAGLAHAEFNVAAWVRGTPAEAEAAQRRAFEAAERAVALAPDLGDGYAARGKMRATFRWDWAGGRADVERAVALDPSNVIGLRSLANVLIAVGSYPEAIAAGRKASELDPLDVGSWAALGLSQMCGGQLGEARTAFTRALELGPELDWIALYLGWLDLLDGRLAQAEARFRALANPLMRATGEALALHARGRAPQAKQALQALVAQHGDAPFQIAEVLAFSGERERALEWLERALARRDANLRFIKADPMLRSLRGEPRYAALLAKVNLQ